jgi:tetratricopeptide (TPR) repeat protein
MAQMTAPQKNRKQTRKPGILFRGRRYSPEKADALALKERARGNAEIAVEIYRLLIEQFPTLAEACNNLGVTLHGLKRHEEALESYDKAVALKPGLAEAWNNRGVVLQVLKRDGEALASLDKALALKSDYPEACCNRGNGLNALKRHEEALESFDKAIALAPDYAEAWNGMAVSLQHLRLYGDAAEACEKALALRPDFAGAWHTLGTILVNKGEMQEAEKMFLKALELNPNFLAPVFNLTHICKYEDDGHADIRAIQALLMKPDLPMEGKESLLYSLGKVLDDCGRYDQAFECYRMANRIRNCSVSYNPQKTEASADSIIKTFSREFLAKPFGPGDRSPIFIVGMPRSGTTLMSNILSNHRSIATAGELTLIGELTSRLRELTGSSAPYPEAARYLTSDIAAGLVSEYVERLRRDTGLKPLFVVDKLPHNFMHLGFITLLFPEARIIHCMRHPLDSGLSNYFQRFQLGLDYSYDLENIGHFYGQYARLMEHWRKVLPVKMLEIDYQETVGDTERTVRRALGYLGLEWDERCLAPHTNPCAVETASQWQVRQPIHKQSVGKWRHYEKHLIPLKAVLERNGHLPYPPRAA